MIWMAWLACSSEPVAEFDDDTRLDGADEALGLDSNQTRMCAAPSGEIFVFWVDQRRGPDLADLWMVWSNDLGQTWFRTPERVNTGNGRVSEPAVACSEQGVVAAWVDDRDSETGRGNVYANVRPLNGAFLEEDVRIDNDPLALGDAQDPVVVIQRDTIGVVWADSLFGSYDIFFARSVDFGGSYSAPFRLGADTPGMAFSAAPSIALGGPGQVWVAWEDTRDGEADIYVQGSTTTGSTFDTPRETRLDKGDELGEYPSLDPQLCGSEAGVVVVWQEARSGKKDDIVFSSSTDGGRMWSAEPQLVEDDNPGFNQSQMPRCVVDGDVTHVVWVDSRAGGADIRHRTIERGVVVGEDVRVDRGEGPGAAIALRPEIALSDDGPVVAWLDDRLAIANGRSQDFKNIYYNHTDADGTWQAEDLRADAGPDGNALRTDLNLAVIGRTVVLAWTDDREGTDDVYVRVLELGSDVEGPEE